MPTLAITPTLQTTRGQKIDHASVLEQIGEPTTRAMGMNRVVNGWDHVRFATHYQAPGAASAAIRITIKLTLLGTYTVERGHLDRSTSEPTYRADQQLIGVAFAELADTVASMLVAGAAGHITTTTDADAA